MPITCVCDNPHMDTRTHSHINVNAALVQAMDNYITCCSIIFSHQSFICHFWDSKSLPVMSQTHVSRYITPTLNLYIHSVFV